MVAERIWKLKDLIRRAALAMYSLAGYSVEPAVRCLQRASDINIGEVECALLQFPTPPASTPSPRLAASAGSGEPRQSHFPALSRNRAPPPRRRA